ncbi:hypothetical protein X743_29595 [Mesorhizobium sp. LNHC252B00]|nr:hypothetical protein X743_29595 [Mesorhizobium sp. LNHC252B00]
MSRACLLPRSGDRSKAVMMADYWGLRVMHDAVEVGCVIILMVRYLPRFL